MARRYIRPEDYYNTIGVEDYYDKIHRTTWTRRVEASCAGGTLGIAFGGIIGAAASYLPVILGNLGVAGAPIGAAAIAAAMPAFGTVMASAALFAIIGSGIGILLNCDVSSNSASVAAGLEEMEKRHKVEKLQDGQAIQGTAPPKKDDMPMSASISPHVKLFSWKVAAITISMFAAFGAILACTPLAATVSATMFGLTGPAAIASCAAMFGMFGSLLGVKNSLITNKTNNFFFKILTEQYFEPAKPKETALVPAREPAAEYAIANTPGKSFAAEVLAAREQAEGKDTNIRSA